MCCYDSRGVKMPVRSRSVLIDNSVGRIFTNTANSLPSDASKLIAGSRIQTKVLAASRTARIQPANNIGRGFYFSDNALVVQVVLSARIAAKGQDAQIRLKKGSSDYESASTINTYTLGENAKINTINVSIAVTAGETIYIDVVQGGSSRPGNGLSIRLNHY